MMMMIMRLKWLSKNDNVSVYDIPMQERILAWVERRPPLTKRRGWLYGCEKQSASDMWGAITLILTLCMKMGKRLSASGGFVP